VLENVKEAIALYLEALREEDRDIPRDEEIAFKVAVTA